MFQRGPRPSPPAGLTVDVATQSDLAAIEEIEHRSFPMPWPTRALDDEVRRVRPYSHVLVARLDGRVVAFTVFWQVLDEAHILNIAVHPHYRRRGIGHALIDAVLAEARRLRLRRATLEVRVSNDTARRMYERMGFRIVAIRERYYIDNDEDAYIMWLDGIIDDERPKRGRRPGQQTRESPHEVRGFRKEE